jgi:hypothetical protein
MWRMAVLRQAPGVELRDAILRKTLGIEGTR